MSASDSRYVYNTYPGPYARSQAPWHPNGHQLGLMSEMAHIAGYPALSSPPSLPFHDASTSLVPTNHDLRWSSLVDTTERYPAPWETSPPVLTVQRCSTVSSNAPYARHGYRKALPVPPQHSYAIDRLPPPPLPPRPPPPALEPGQHMGKLYPDTSREVENLNLAFSSLSFSASPPSQLPTKQGGYGYLDSVPDDPDGQMAMVASFGRSPPSACGLQTPPQDIPRCEPSTISQRTSSAAADNPQYEASTSPRLLSSATADVPEDKVSLSRPMPSKTAEVPENATQQSGRAPSGTAAVPTPITKSTTAVPMDPPRCTPTLPADLFDPTSDSFDPTELAEEEVPPYSLVDETSPPNLRDALSGAGVPARCPFFLDESLPSVPLHTATEPAPLSPVGSQRRSHSPIYPADSMGRRSFVLASNYIDAPFRMPSPPLSLTSASSTNTSAPDMRGSTYAHPPRSLPDNASAPTSSGSPGFTTQGSRKLRKPSRGSAPPLRPPVPPRSQSLGLPSPVSPQSPPQQALYPSIQQPTQKLRKRPPRTRSAADSTFRALLSD